MTARWGNATSLSDAVNYGDVPPVKGIYAGNARTPCASRCAWQGSTERGCSGSAAEGVVIVLTRMRIRLPDVPGALGAVAAEIGTVNGNVIGLEVLRARVGSGDRRSSWSCRTSSVRSRPPAAGVRNVPGAGVEEVTVAITEAKDREDTVLAAAAGILQAATPTAALNALTGHLIALFDLTWLALADDAGWRASPRCTGMSRPCSGLPPSPRGPAAAPIPPTTPPAPGCSSRRFPRPASSCVGGDPWQSGAASGTRSRSSGHGGVAVHRRARRAPCRACHRLTGRRPVRI